METDDRTIQDFGSQWTTFTEFYDFHGSTEMLEDYMHPFVGMDAVHGKKVAEIGSGAGRIVHMLVQAGAASVTAVEPSEAHAVISKRYENTDAPVKVFHGRGDAMPLDDFDLIVSFGVLHHIVDPSATVRRAHEALAPGGQFVAWLYGREGNELYLAIFEPLRKVTTKLPQIVLQAISISLLVPLCVYEWLCRYIPLPMHKYMRDYLQKLGWKERYLTIYDQLNPQYAKYYQKNEVEALFRDAGFDEIRTHHRHGYSWTIAGRKSAR